MLWGSRFRDFAGVEATGSSLTRVRDSGLRVSRLSFSRVGVNG